MGKNSCVLQIENNNLRINQFLIKVIFQTVIVFKTPATLCHNSLIKILLAESFQEIILSLGLCSFGTPATPLKSEIYLKSCFTF